MTFNLPSISAYPKNITNRHLVVVRAGDTSLHTGWGAGEPGCTFDLIVSYFGDDPDAFRAPWEQRVDRKGGKWDGIHDLFVSRPELLDSYDYFWFPDDDIDAERTTIEAIFAAMRVHELSVAQPALTLDSYFSFFPLLQSRSFAIRFVDMIEVMMPCLDRPTLEAVLPFLSGRMSGFGLDLVWSRLGPDNRGRSAVLDRLAVRHTRPVGSVLAKAVARLGLAQRDELHALQQRFGFSQVYPLTYEAIDLSGRRWRSQGAIGLRLAADYYRCRAQIRQKEFFGRDVRRLVKRHAVWRPQLAPLASARIPELP